MARRGLTPTLVELTLIVSVLGAVGAARADAQALSRDLLDRYCVTCHNDRLKTANLLLDHVDLGQVGAHAEALEKVVRKLRAGQMPPEGRPQPDAAAVEAFVTALEVALDAEAAGRIAPGRVASRRLNRVEYVHAIEDLLDLRVDGAELLPGDMAGFGFDNNADVLAMTPSLMARYIAAATTISRIAVGSLDNRADGRLYTLGFEQQDDRMHEDMPFGTHGGLAARHVFPLDGEYLFTIRMKRMFGDTVGTILGIGDRHDIELRIDHALVSRWDIGGQTIRSRREVGLLVANNDDEWSGYRTTADHEMEIRMPVKAGQRLVSVSFRESNPTPVEGDYGQPGIDRVFIAGPYDGAVPAETPIRARIFVCRPASPSAEDERTCAREILGALARRAYRRPVTDRDLAVLLPFYEDGRQARGFEHGIERGLEAILSMPEFLLRAERQPDGVSRGDVYRLTDLELASRLSFFLWRSIPDDELLDLAAEGRLSDPTVLGWQVRRMLADPKATRFLSDFVGQWLQIRNINEQTPDGGLFAQFNDTLRKAMVTETELFFESQVRENRPIPELLTTDYTFLNELLARHYGVDDVYGSRFRRVTLDDDRRHGLLGHASLLTITSYANRTSVVLRGKWVLENLLGAPPPPPPPNVPPLKENDPAGEPTSLREKMEQHRSNPVCASCHAKIDPLGFALEHFDAIGQWRETDGGAAINATIAWEGQTIDSPRAFREALLGRGTTFVRTVTEKLLTYALGRGVDYRDAPTVRQLVRELAADDYRWSSLITGIVRSPPFQMRQAPEADNLVAGAATHAVAKQGE